MIQLNKISKYQETEMIRKHIKEVGKCIHCGVRNDTLVVHHTKKKNRYPELRFDKKYWAVVDWICHSITEQGGVDRFGRKWEAKEFNDYLINKLENNE